MFSIEKSLALAISFSLSKGLFKALFMDLAKTASGAMNSLSLVMMALPGNPKMRSSSTTLAAESPAVDGPEPFSLMRIHSAPCSMTWIRTSRVDLVFSL